MTRCTVVRPKIVKSVHYCPATGQYQSREYRDVTSNTGAPTTTVYPTKCAFADCFRQATGLVGRAGGAACRVWCQHACHATRTLR